MNPELRFFLAKKSGKIPIERKWNSHNNYSFFDSRLLEHIENNGNYGLCCGFGQIIVLDFDDWDYYKSIRDKLPHTFTVQTANKKTYHKYYYLKGEMFKKIGVDVDGKRVCDIQAQGSGVIGPESRYNRSYYTIRYNEPIATIPLETIVSVFKVRPKIPKAYNGKTPIDAPEKVLNALKILDHLKVQRMSERHFKCPFHDMKGQGNLYLFSNGGLYCFHCQVSYKDIQQFVDDLIIWRERK